MSIARTPAGLTRYFTLDMSNSGLNRHFQSWETNQLGLMACQLRWALPGLETTSAPTIASWPVHESIRPEGPVVLSCGWICGNEHELLRRDVVTKRATWKNEWLPTRTGTNSGITNVDQFLLDMLEPGPASSLGYHGDSEAERLDLIQRS